MSNGKTEIYTYINPLCWEENPYFEKYIKNSVHICASSNLMKGIKERYHNKNSPGEMGIIFAVNPVIEKLFPGFKSPERQLSDFLLLSRIIDSLEVYGEDTELKEAFSKNIGELFGSVRLLSFIGFSPELLAEINLSPVEKMFRRIFSLFMEERGDFNLPETFSREYVLDVLQEIIYGTGDSYDIRKLLGRRKNRIVLHGFYFITAEQQTVLEILKRSGFEIVFFNLYDERFEATFGFIKKYISEEYGWGGTWNTEKSAHKPVRTPGTVFLQDFEPETGEKKFTLPERKIFRYDSFYHFLDGAVAEHYRDSRGRRQPAFLSTASRDMNGLMSQYYPEKYMSRRNFLHYPVGKFILNLHEMIDREGRIIMTEKILISAFSSGWIRDAGTGENANMYTGDLENIMPFFQDVKYLKDWKERIRKLESIAADTVSRFAYEGEERAVENVASPFSKFSQFSVPRDRLAQIYTFLKMLERTAEALFKDDSRTVRLDIHAGKLAGILRSYDPLKNHGMTEDEKKIILELEEKLSRIDSDDFSLKKDLSKALSLYLGGKFSSEEESFVKSFRELDGEVFFRNRPRYITGLDSQKIPLAESGAIWPLREETYRGIAVFDRYIRLDLIRRKNMKPLSRYLMYNALEFLDPETTEFSWITDMLNTENLKPAVYITQMGMKITNGKYGEDRIGKIKNTETEWDIPYEENYGAADSDDLLAEYRLCPRRFYFGFILNRYPVFSKDFMQKFLYGSLVKVIKKYSEETDKKVMEAAGDIFPQWSSYKKDFLGKENLKYYRKITGKMSPVKNTTEVTDARINFIFPGIVKKITDSLYGEYDREKIRSEIVSGGFRTEMDARPSYSCRFCPYLAKCGDGAYPVDGEYDNGEKNE